MGIHVSCFCSTSIWQYYPEVSRYS